MVATFKLYPETDLFGFIYGLFIAFVIFIRGT